MTTFEASADAPDPADVTHGRLYALDIALASLFALAVVVVVWSALVN